MRKLSLFLVAVILSVIFMSSCVERQIPVTETYYETAYKTEFVEVESSRDESRQTALIPSEVWYYGKYFYVYDISMKGYKNGRVDAFYDSGGYVGICDLTSPEAVYVYCPECGQDILYPELQWASKILRHVKYETIVNMDTTNVRRFAVISIKRTQPNVLLSWMRTIIEPMFVAQEVPYLIEKQRIVMVIKRVPFWAGNK